MIRANDELAAEEPWPDWFRRFVLLGRNLRHVGEEQSEKGTTLFVVLALPTRQLAAAALAIGLVASSTADRTPLRKLRHAQDFEALQNGAILRVVKTGRSVSHVDRIQIETARFESLRLRSGEPEVLLTVRSGGYEHGATYRIGQGTTTFEATDLPLGMHTQLIEGDQDGIRAWLPPTGTLQDFFGSINSELLWIGEKSRIVQDISMVVENGTSTTTGAEPVAIRDLLRVRSGSGLSGEGWHTRLESSVADVEHFEPIFGPAKVTVLDGNSAIYRHLNAVRSPLNVCLLDSGGNMQLGNAIQVLEERARWAAEIQLSDLGIGRPPTGIHLAAFAEGGF